MPPKAKQTKPAKRAKSSPASRAKKPQAKRAAAKGAAAKGAAAKGAAAKRPAAKKKTVKPTPEYAKVIYDRLIEHYPNAHCALDFSTPFQLLIATILSAQCTDKRVNMVTPALFDRYPTPAALAAAKPEELERSEECRGGKEGE